ncbi:MAG: PAS domain-containing protein [Pseudomonadota bacterium]
MIHHTLHPNTRALLQAWTRIASHPQRVSEGPSADDYPGLLNRLFVLGTDGDDRAPFRITGEKLPELLGRDVAELDFMSFWQGHDRPIIWGLLGAVAACSSPALIKARGSTLSGRTSDLEIAIAPLEGSGVKKKRLLGLYQNLSPDTVLGGHPLARHRLNAVVMPQPRGSKSRLRLVASND